MHKRRRKGCRQLDAGEEKETTPEEPWEKS
jgi:hypothetical protein